jgi:hypothetical protein
MEQDNRDAEIIRLEGQLHEVAVAENFPETDTGRLWLQLATAEINHALKDITSDKYEKDHTGYVKRLADLQAYKKMIRKMQVAASPIRKQKIQEALGQENATV